MASIQLTSLTRYDLLETEQLAGQLFTIQNKQVMQNLLADICEERLALKFDPEHPSYFLQQEAELTGKSLILKYLLECSQQAESEELYRAQEAASWALPQQ